MKKGNRYLKSLKFSTLYINIYIYLYILDYQPSQVFAWLSCSWFWYCCLPCQESSGIERENTIQWSSIVRFLLHWRPPEGFRLHWRPPEGFLLHSGGLRRDFNYTGGFWKIVKTLLRAIYIRLGVLNSTWRIQISIQVVYNSTEEIQISILGV